MPNGLPNDAKVEPKSGPEGDDFPKWSICDSYTPAQSKPVLSNPWMAYCLLKYHHKPTKTTSSKPGPRKNCQNSPRSQKKMIQGRKCAKNDPLQVDPRTIFFSFFSSRVLNASPGGGSRVGFSMILDDLDLIFHHLWTRLSSFLG